MFDNKYDDWEDMPPKGVSKGYLNKYQNRVVVIVAKGEGKKMYLTDETCRALGDPQYVILKTKGRYAALMKDEKGVGYKVTKGNKDRTSYITITSIVKKLKLRSGVYDAKVESGAVVFDYEQYPSTS